MATQAMERKRRENSGGYNRWNEEKEEEPQKKLKKWFGEKE